MADVRVPRYLGRVLSEDGTPWGTCFQVAPGILVTARHVLADLGADRTGAVVSLDGLAGGPIMSGEVVRVDPDADLAVVRVATPLDAVVPGLAPTDSMPMAGEVVVTGVSAVDDPGHEYRYLDTVGAWGGGTTRDENVRLGRLETSALVPGMSGAPVRRLADDLVVGVVSARYNSADGWLRGSVWITRTEDLVPLLAGIADVPLVAGAPGRLSGHVPRLPRNFVPRADELDTLVGMVLAERDEPVVVHGMPGIGKTVLTTALARDERVLRSFPDGVAWVSLGRERNLVRGQALLAEELGDVLPAFADPRQGAVRLTSLLAERSCLLVLDDVWFVEDLEAFDVLGPRCRMVITTRDARVGVPLTAVDHRVGVLPEDLAIELLTRWAGQDTDHERAREVVWACGRLPLAVSMIGAMVRGRGDRWDNVLAKLRAADLGNIRQHFLGYPYDSLLKALRVSVDALPETDVAARYLDFALFREDVAVPEAVLLMLWQADGVPVPRAQDDVDLLVERSLVQRVGDGLLSLHDLLFDYVRAVRAEKGDTQDRQGRLLAAYRTRCPHGWPSGPDDGYFFQYLSHHLVEAGQVDELHLLLADTDADGRNAWYEAKRAVGDVAGFIADVDLAWSLAGRVGLHLRYALVTASLNSFADNMPPPLLAAVLVHDLQRPRDVLTYATRAPDPDQRCAALAALAPHLPLDLLDEATAVAEETGCADVIGRLAARFAELGRTNQGRAATDRIDDPVLRAAALAGIARHDNEVAEEAIRTAAEITARGARTSALSRVAAILADAGLAEAAVGTAQRIPDENKRWDALGRIAAHLPPPLAEDAVTRAWAVADPPGRTRALLPLVSLLTEPQLREFLNGVPELRNRADEAVAYAAAARYLPEPTATEVLERALTRAAGVKNQAGRAEAMATVAAGLPEHLVSAALERVDTWQLHRAPAVAALAARLAELGRPEQAVGLVESTHHIGERTEILAAVAPRLPRAELSRVIDIAGVIGDDVVRGHALARLVPHLVESDRVEDAIAVISRGSFFTDDVVTSEVVIAGRLAEEDRDHLLEEAWYAALETGGRQRAISLRALAPSRPLDVLAEVARDIRRMFSFPFDPWPDFLHAEDHAAVLGDVAAAGHLEPAVSLVRELRGPADSEVSYPGSHEEAEYGAWVVALVRAAIVGHLLKHVPDGSRAELAAEALDCFVPEWTGITWVTGVGDVEDTVLAVLVRNLPDSMVDRAAVLATTRAEHRDLVLHETTVALAVRTAGADVRQALDAALTAQPPSTSGSIQHHTTVSFSDNSVTTRFGSLKYDATAALPRIAGELSRAELDYLLTCLSAPAWQRRPGLDEVYSAVAIRLAEVGDSGRALDHALALPGPWPRYGALKAVAAHLTGSEWLSESLLRELAGQTRANLLYDLAALTPALVAIGGDDLITDVIAAIHDVGSWWP